MALETHGGQDEIGGLPSPAGEISVIGLLKQIAASSVDLSTMEALLQQIEDNTDGLEALVTAGNVSLSNIDADVDGLNQETTQLDVLAALNSIDTSTDGIEALIASTNAALAAVNANVDGVEGLLTAIGANTDGLEGLITASNALLTTINGNVDGIEGLLTAISGSVDGLEACCAASNALLTTIDASANGLEFQIGEVADPVPTSFSVLWRLRELMLKLDSLIASFNAASVTGTVKVFHSNANGSAAGLVLHSITVPVGKTYRLIQLVVGSDPAMEADLRIGVGVLALADNILGAFADSGDTTVVPLHLPPVPAGSKIELFVIGAPGGGTKTRTTIILEEL